MMHLRCLLHKMLLTGHGTAMLVCWQLPTTPNIDYASQPHLVAEMFLQRHLAVEIKHLISPDSEGEKLCNTPN